MRLLIDGYNLMYARGALGRKLGPQGLRRVRLRFLNDLAAALDEVLAHQTTVVFDAAQPPPGQPAEITHKGMTIEFAQADEDADARIEWHIAHHSAPKQLTVVSSDHRIRTAASRRKATALTSEVFLEQLEARRQRTQREEASGSTPEDAARAHGLSPDEAAYWEHEFRDVVEDPRTRNELTAEPSFLSDEQIAEIERELRESGELD